MDQIHLCKRNPVDTCVYQQQAKRRGREAGISTCPSSQFITGPTAPELMPLHDTTVLRPAEGEEASLREDRGRWVRSLLFSGNLELTGMDEMASIDLATVTEAQPSYAWLQRI